MPSYESFRQTQRFPNRCLADDFEMLLLIRLTSVCLTSATQDLETLLLTPDFDMLHLMPSFENHLADG